jgi:hypothetical protein
MLQKSLQSLPREAGHQMGAGSAVCSKKYANTDDAFFDKGMYIL